MADQEEDQGITAYHGSPHEFEQFDLSKIGTGEGAQAYGHGLYFAESEPVAKGYRDELSKSQGDMLTIRANDKIIKGESLSSADLDAIKYLDAGKRAAGQFPHNTAYYAKQILTSSPGFNPENEYAKSILSKIDEYKDAKWGYEPNKGHMYEVSINAHPDQFIDYNQSLKNQHPFVKERMRNALAKKYNSQNLANETIESDADFKDILDNFDDMQPHEISKMFHDEGIKGVRYLDAGSRKEKEKPTRNYVVFDDKLVNVKRRYARGGEVESNMNGYRRGGKVDVNKLAKDTIAKKQNGKVHPDLKMDVPIGESKERMSNMRANVPVRWASSPDHPSAHLAYITDAEAELLKKADLHNSNIAHEHHVGPGGVPSYQGGGIGAGGSMGSGSSGVGGVAGSGGIGGSSSGGGGGGSSSSGGGGSSNGGGGGGGGGSMAAARAADRSSVAGYSADRPASSGSMAEARAADRASVAGYSADRGKTADKSGGQGMVGIGSDAVVTARNIASLPQFSGYTPAQIMAAMDRAGITSGASANPNLGGALSQFSLSGYRSPAGFGTPENDLGIQQTIDGSLGAKQVQDVLSNSGWASQNAPAPTGAMDPAIAARASAMAQQQAAARAASPTAQSSGLTGFESALGAVPSAINVPGPLVQNVSPALAARSGFAPGFATGLGSGAGSSIGSSSNIVGGGGGYGDTPQPASSPSFDPNSVLPNLSQDVARLNEQMNLYNQNVGTFFGGLFGATPQNLAQEFSNISGTPTTITPATQAQMQTVANIMNLSNAPQNVPANFATPEGMLSRYGYPTGTTPDRAGSMGTMPSGTTQYGSDLTPMSSQPSRPVTPTPPSAYGQPSRPVTPTPSTARPEQQREAIKSVRSNFNNAFAEARARGDSVFSWTNPITGRTGQYTTQLARKQGGRVPSLANPEDWVAPVETIRAASKISKPRKPSKIDGTAIVKRASMLSSRKS